jgi:hypothetical protein
VPEPSARPSAMRNPPPPVPARPSAMRNPPPAPAAEPAHEERLAEPYAPGPRAGGQLGTVAIVLIAIVAGVAAFFVSKMLF